jgi:carbonic anhydrase
MSENDGIAKLIEGHRHFSEEVYPEHRELFDQLKNQQNPQVLFITCADSRIDPSLITHTNPGDLFICRNIGNIVPAYGEMMGGVSAVVEYAVMALSVRDIIVCGHTDCGAMKALKNPDAPALAAMPTVKSWLRNAHAALSVAKAKHPEAEGDSLTHILIEENVLLQLQHLRTHPSVAAGLASGNLRLHGCIYNIGNGRIDVYDETAQKFAPIEKVLADRPKASDPKVTEHPGAVADPHSTVKAG